MLREQIFRKERFDFAFELYRTLGIVPYSKKTFFHYYGNASLLGWFWKGGS
jgi:hypothetical protein